MSVHEIHPASTEARVLNANCSECCSKSIFRLDPDFLYSATGLIKRQIDTLVEDYPQLWEVLEREPAIEIQERYLRQLAASPSSFSYADAKLKLMAMHSPIEVPAESSTPPCYAGGNGAEDKTK